MTISPSLPTGAPLLLVWVLLVPLVSGLNHRDWLTLRTERAYILSSYNHVLTSRYTRLFPIPY